MAKRNFAIAAAALLCVLQIATAANAQSPGLNPSCALLGELVRQATVNEILVRRGEPAYAVPASLTNVREPRACSDTTAAVSSGFAAALGQFGIHVRWSLLPRGTGIVCLSHNLEYCHPLSDPMGPSMTADDLAFVGNSWNRLRGKVAARMPWGTSSDIAYFRAASIMRQLQPAGSGPALPEVRAISGY